MRVFRNGGEIIESNYKTSAALFACVSISRMETSTTLGVLALIGIVVVAYLINHIVNESHARRKRHEELMQALKDITEKIK